MSTEEQQYIKGFNHGYLITKHEPVLAAQLASGIQPTDNEYLAGFVSGKEEYEIEMNRAHLDELKHLRGKSLDKEYGLEKE